jgi:hypothetical protein
MTHSTVDACVSGQLLASGLAYGVFQSADGTIDVVGIVPDSVTVVQIAGVQITPHDNVWHLTTEHPAPTLDFAVSNADGTIVAATAA